MIYHAGIKKLMQALCDIQLFILKVKKHNIWICTILPQSSSLYGGKGNLDYLEIQIVFYVTSNNLWYR